MLNTREIATILAALRYWQEEMCPYGMAAMQFYLPPEEQTSLTADEIDQLSGRLVIVLIDGVRYAVCDPSGSTLLDLRIFRTADQAAAAIAANGIVATLLLS